MAMELGLEGGGWWEDSLDFNDQAGMGRAAGTATKPDTRAGTRNKGNYIDRGPEHRENREERVLWPTRGGHEIGPISSIWGLRIFRGFFRGQVKCFSSPRPSDPAEYPASN